jgi:hypothetical protein
MLTDISKKLNDFESGKKFTHNETIELLYGLIQHDMLKDLPLLYSTIINIYIKSGDMKGEYITSHPCLPSKANIDDYEPQFI